MIKSIVSSDQFKLIYSKPFQNLIVNGVRASAMFAMIKILAVYGGPASLASFANFQNLIGLILILVTLSLQTGLTIETAKNVVSQRPLMICISILFLLIPVALLAAYIFLDRLMLVDDLLSADSYFLYFTILILPFSVNSLLVASEVGRQRYSNILVNYVLVGIFPIVTAIFSNDGFLEKIIAGYCFGNWVGAIFLLGRIGVSPALFFKFNVNKKLAISMLRYGVVSGSIGIFTAVTAFTMRQYLSKEVSVEDAGNWEALVKIGALFQFAIAAPLISTGMPLMVHALKEGPKAIVSLIILRTKALFILVALSITISWILADWIVLLLFSEDFLLISPLIVLMILSESFKAFGGIFILAPMANQQFGIVLLTYMFSTIGILAGIYLLSALSLLTLPNVTWLYLSVSFFHAVFICAWISTWLHRRSEKYLDTIT